jgi:hypothetical protein
MADTGARGTNDRGTESRGLDPVGATGSAAWAARGAPATAAGLSLGRSYRGSWPEMAFQASMMGFTVTGRNEQPHAGQPPPHNVGSRHFAGEAIDVRTAGKTNAQVAEFMAFMRSQGYLVKDERVRPPGQAVWSGPHVHVETFDWDGFIDAFSALRQVR